MHPIRKTRRTAGSGGLRLAATGALVATLLAAGCSDAVIPLLTTWEADLRPLSPGQRASATVAVVSQSGRAVTSIQMTGDGEGRYGWRILTGSCQAPGDVVGGRAAYPHLEPGADGTASGQTILSRELQPEGEYAAWMYRLGAGDAETPAACGALVRRR